MALSQDKFVKTGSDLVVLETVLRDVCKNCREEGHKIWNCPYLDQQQKQKSKVEEFMDLVKCKLCNGVSHIARDCPKYKNYNEQTELEQDFEFYKYLRDLEGKNAQIESIKKIQQDPNTQFVTQSREPSNYKAIADK